MYSKKILTGAFFLLGVFSCKKDKITFDPVPQIEVLSISPSTASEYTDPVTLTLNYKDGDGDLGENTSGVSNCFVKDNRIGIVSSFRIQQLAPDGSSVPITGTLNINLGGQGITDSTSQQNVTFDVYVVDRAGNHSNTVTTGPVKVVR